MDEISESRNNGSAPAVGALLVHGWNGCQNDMVEICDLLSARGVIAENILLPGHGVPAREMLTVGWSDWAHAVRTELHRLQQQCSHVFLIGHSLGGALCLHVAAHEQVTGLVAMCAPIYMPDWMLPAVRMARRIVPMLPAWREDIWDREARRRYTRGLYRWAPMAPVESMLQYLPQLRTELSSVTAPILIMNAKRDHVVPARDGQALYELIGSPEKTLLTFERSFHIIMKDYEREEVYTRVLEFVEQHASGLLPAPRM